MSSEKKIKHLEFIQLTITRMNVNSFLVKGWLVTLVAAVFILSQKDTNKTFIWVAPFVAILFWVMDAFFVSTERKFRALYDCVRTLPEEQIDFSMNTAPYENGKGDFFRCLMSLTLLLFYPFIIVASIIAAACLNK